MDRHPQQIKRERQDIKKRARNVSNMSRLRTEIKNVLQSTDKDKAQAEYTKAVSLIDKAVGKGLIHKNTAARRKSRITRHLNSLT
jgi:small subunit ribosomal protein S20|tara:strand:- start:7921 stop:8175 length:255 start_codon:yes stop_codon:yes gene_type:complete